MYEMEPDSARAMAEKCAEEIGRQFRRDITAIVEGRIKSEIDGSIVRIEDVIEEGRIFATSETENAIELAILRYTEAWKRFQTENKQGQE